MKKRLTWRSLWIFLLVNIGLFPINFHATHAQGNIQAGNIIKAKGNSALYYIADDGKRYVFPNDLTYFTWYNDFSSVSEVDAKELSRFDLGGNVTYRPGVLLVKAQTDPKVYAVSKNGMLRWVKNEDLARKLYGENWYYLVDDIPVVLLVSYRVGPPIENDSDFDPDNEENSTTTINENIRLALAEKLEKKEQKTLRKNLEFCEKTEKQINKIQKRLLKRGIKVEGIGETFFQKCAQGAALPQDVKQKPNKKDENDNKIAICHIPPGNAQAKHTIVVGIPAAKAHLAHGDALGPCENGGVSDTQPPVISNITATSTSSTMSTIKWTTDEQSTSKVIYAKENLSSATTTLAASDSTLVTQHSLTLTGLMASTQYFFKVESKDTSNNTASSTELSFTTLAAVPEADTTPPVLSNIETASTTATTIKIMWDTNEPSTSVVEYATSPFSSATSIQTLVDNSLMTSHSVMVSGLTASTTYYYRVKSKDASNNIATSVEKTFTTLPIEDTTPPVISSITATAHATSTDVSWTTDEPSTTKVIYATQSLASATSTFSVLNNAHVTSHLITLPNLLVSTQYFFKVESQDAKGNVSTSAELTFTTAP